MLLLTLVILESKVGKIKKAEFPMVLSKIMEWIEESLSDSPLGKSILYCILCSSLSSEENEGLKEELENESDDPAIAGNHEAQEHFRGRLLGP